MKTIHYNDYELLPIACFEQKKQKAQIKVYKRWKFLFDAPVCDTIDEARKEAKRLIDQLNSEENDKEIR
jgi:hypothetical protein